jgi:hypothetical protein
MAEAHLALGLEMKTGNLPDVAAKQRAFSRGTF